MKTEFPKLGADGTCICCHGKQRLVTDLWNKETMAMWEPCPFCCEAEAHITARAVPNGDAPMPIRRRSVRERLQNIVRDFFGTFGAAVCTLVPFCSNKGGEHTTGAFQKPFIIKGLAARSAEI